MFVFYRDCLHLEVQGRSVLVDCIGMSMQHNVQAQPTPIDDLSNIFAPIDVLIVSAVIHPHSVLCGPRLHQLAVDVLDVAPAVFMCLNGPWKAFSSTDHIIVSMRCVVEADSFHHMGIEHIFPHRSRMGRPLRLHLTEHDVSYFEIRIKAAPFRTYPAPVDWVVCASVPGMHTRIFQRGP